jgi:hypothetical protein
MTEPRDDEAGREALVERFALALVSNPAWYENAVKASHADGPRLAEQVWARAHDIVYARPAPPAATAPSGESSQHAATVPQKGSNARREGELRSGGGEAPGVPRRTSHGEATREPDGGGRAVDAASSVQGRTGRDGVRCATPGGADIHREHPAALSSERGSVRGGKEGQGGATDGGRVAGGAAIGDAVMGCGDSATPRDEAAALLREVATLLNGGDTRPERDLCARIDAYLRALASAALAAQPAAGRGREDGYGIDLSNIRLSELPPFGKVYRYSEKDDAWLPTERAPGPEGGERSA